MQLLNVNDTFFFVNRTKIKELDTGNWLKICQNAAKELFFSLFLPVCSAGTP